MPLPASRILRRLDRLGRAAIPQELRDAFGPRADARLALAGGDLPARERHRLVCVFCGADDHVIPHRGKGICVDCVREVREIVSSG